MASVKELTNLSDSTISKIELYMKSLNCTDNEWELKAQYVAQLFYNNDISIETTCLILSGFIDISNLQQRIERIYASEIPLILSSEIMDVLGLDVYQELEKLVKSEKPLTGIYTGKIDENTDVVINYGLKQVLQVKKAQRKGAMDTNIPVIEAVPKKLIVYDSSITDQPRNFKIIWDSKFSNRNFAVTGEGIGANINEIKDYLIEAGFSHNQKLVPNTVACMVNTLIDNGLAEIRTDIDNKGVYFNKSNEEIIPVKMDITKPSFDEMNSAIQVLLDLSKHFKNNIDVFISVFKWGLMSVFSYAMKQTGNWLPHLYLKGAAGSGKTTLAKIMLYLYDEPSSENNIGGASFNTEYRIGNKISQDCLIRVVNEPKSCFSKDSTTELIKVCVESITARKIQGKVYPAFSPVIYTANQYLPEDDALIRRMYVLSFTHFLRKTDDEKQSFDSEFHVNVPRLSKLNELKAFGKFFIREIITDPSLLMGNWQSTADTILSKFFDEAEAHKPKWLEEWAVGESLDDYDASQKESIRNFFIQKFNDARKKITLRDENGYITDHNIGGDGSSDGADFTDINWSIVNNRLISWAIPHIKRDKSKNVCFSQGIRKELSDLGIENDLKSISELMGWDYKNIKFKHSQMRCIEVDFDEFMDFLYPSFESDNTDPTDYW